MARSRSRAARSVASLLRSLLALCLVLAAANSFPAHYSPRLTASTPYLPFDLSTTTTVRKVFAHYMPNFPISIDNVSSDQDYYTTQWLTPTGEGGIHAAYGGLLRDRPLPRSPISASNWKDLDQQTEINQAKTVGIDGFSVDIILPRSASDVPARMLANAHTVGNFSIFVTADMSGPLGDYTAPDFAAEFVTYLTSPSAFKLADGRAVLGAFLAELKPVSWWTSVLDALRNKYGVSVAFVPTFLNGSDYLDSFAPICYGFSNWGGRNPQTVPITDQGPASPYQLIRKSHALGKKWMQPIAFQDNRPYQGTYEESNNWVTNRQGWQVSIQQGADWVQLITWNDYAEMTAMAPSAKHGWRLLDMNAYAISQYKYGPAPTILRDTLYVSHRAQPYAATPTYPETKMMTLIPGYAPARDKVEVVSYAMDASTVWANIGPRTYSCTVPAGLGVCTFPLQLGSVVVGLARDGVWKTTVTSPLQVTNTPYVQDEQYTVAGGRR